MTSTVESSLAMEINQVHEELFADAACEASWMPAHVLSDAGSINCDVACHHHLAALKVGKRAPVKSCNFKLKPSCQEIRSFHSKSPPPAQPTFFHFKTFPSFDIANKFYQRISIGEIFHSGRNLSFFADTRVFQVTYNFCHECLTPWIVSKPGKVLHRHDSVSFRVKIVCWRF